MIGQGGGRGAARDLTDNPDFVMMEANSPPLGQKRNGGSKTTSAEKRNKASSTEKKSKPTPKDKTPPTQHFWLGFDTMEKLALEEGAPHNLELAPTHSFAKKGRSEKDAAELLT